jgi:hypothetical protein
MKLPTQTEPTLWGALAGAALITLIGFGFADWQTAGGSATLGQARANKAVAAALAPVCAEMFKRDANFTANLVELKKADEWARASYIEKGGWGKMPEALKLDSETARSCAALLVKA